MYVLYIIDIADIVRDTYLRIIFFEEIAYY